MKVNNTASILKNIRDNYVRLNQMTENLSFGSKVFRIDKIIGQRERILSEIKDEQKRLDQYCAQWKKQCADDPVLANLKSEIELLITAVLVLDTMIQEGLSDRIEEIKSEVRSLTKTSKAAISYAKHGK